MDTLYKNHFHWSIIFMRKMVDLKMSLVLDKACTIFNKIKKLSQDLLVKFFYDDRQALLIYLFAKMFFFNLFFIA